MGARAPRTLLVGVGVVTALVLVFVAFVGVATVGSVVDGDDPAPLRSSTVASDHVPIRTEHATISYEASHADEAERVAAAFDDHYRLLHQQFGVDPGDGRVTVVVAAREDLPCDAVGCVDPLGRIYLTRGDRALLHHELVHLVQLRTHWSPVTGYLNPDTAKGAMIEGSARFLESPPDAIAADARFDPDRVSLTPFPTNSTEYAEGALFVEHVLATYGREAFDAIYLEGSVEDLEAATEVEYDELQAGFAAGLDDQRERLASGGSVLPAFTYEPFRVESDETVTFDARTPDAVAALDRTWYPEEPEEFTWDLTGDGSVDERGPTATATFEDPGDHEVTLTVTIDGEEHVATQRLLADPNATDVEGTETNGSGVIEDGVDETDDGGSAEERSAVEGGDVSDSTDEETNSSANEPSPIPGFTVVTGGIALAMGISLTLAGALARRIKRPPAGREQ